MIHRQRLNGPRDVHLGPQLAFEALLTAYAAVSALLLARLVLLSLGVHPNIWSGHVVYTVTAPLVLPFTVFPGATRHVLGEATLPDLTAVAILALLPLAESARRRAGPGRS